MPLRVFSDFYDAKATYKDSDGNVILKQDEWITFNYVTEMPTIFADDEDIFETATVDVHCFTPNGARVQNYKRQIKNALRAAEFVIESTELFVEENKHKNTTSEIYHIVVTISYEDETEV